MLMKIMVIKLIFTAIYIREFVFGDNFARFFADFKNSYLLPILQWPIEPLSHFDV